MNLELPGDVSDFVSSLVSSGRFDSEEAAVVEGVRLLMGREKLRGDIASGLKQLDDGDSFSEDEVFEELHREIERIESAPTKS